MNSELYDILNLNKNATQQDIKKSYRKLAIKYHPDNNINDKIAENKYKKISHAYNILSDPINRKKYDTGDENDFGNIFQSFNNIFKNQVESFMNNSQNCDIGNIINNLKKKSKEMYKEIPKKKYKKINGKPIIIKINIKCSLKDMYLGKKQKIQINKKKTKNGKTIDIFNVFHIPIVGDELLIDGYGHDLKEYSLKGDVIIKISNPECEIFKRINKYDLIINYKINLLDFYKKTEIVVKLPDDKILTIKYNYLEMIKSEKYNIKIKKKRISLFKYEKKRKFINKFHNIITY